MEREPYRLAPAGGLVDRDQDLKRIAGAPSRERVLEAWLQEAIDHDRNFLTDGGIAGLAGVIVRREYNLHICSSMQVDEWLAIDGPVSIDDQPASRAVDDEPMVRGPVHRLR